MIRFFEHQEQHIQPRSAALSDTKLSQLLKFARASRMQKDIFFPSVSSSLLNGYDGSNEQRPHICNGTTDHFNSRYSGSFITYGNSDGAQLQGFYKGTAIPTPTPTEGFAATPIKIPSGSSDLSMAATFGNLRISNPIHGHPTGIVETRKHNSTTDLIRVGATSKHDSKRQKTSSHSYSDKPFLTPSDKSSTIPTQQINGTVRKSQKLGDKITALQQLVSPFGKTDTASVLHEAAIYIKVLHEQIQVLTSPYFQRNFHTNLQQSQETERASLNSRGLCLVPLSTTIFDFAKQQQHTHQYCEPERIKWRVGYQSPLR